MPPIAILGRSWRDRRSSRPVAAHVDPQSRARGSPPRRCAFSFNLLCRWSRRDRVASLAACAKSRVERRVGDDRSALNSRVDSSEAKSAYRRALALDDRSALAGRARLVLYKPTCEERATRTGARSPFDPAFADAYLRLAFVEGRLGRSDAAVPLLRQGRRILPMTSHPPCLGQHLFATGDYARRFLSSSGCSGPEPRDGSGPGCSPSARRRLG